MEIITSRSVLCFYRMRNGRSFKGLEKYHIYINTLTPKPAVTDHASSILVGRISADCYSERGAKAVGQEVIKGTLRGEMRDDGPDIHISHHP
ncbi:hypothetical protein AVEN_183139-1 [Araneus ventricosus]|uniref:Uncharacterized protein n=1 Tax=Araneus ventricosus TaxID=182803 RepID=A0A4Y2IQ24_ARAVE|nr:hypothetical protein AVEN_183139-1 [Araneus ventricosus]